MAKKKKLTPSNLLLLPNVVVVDDDKRRQCHSMLEFILNSGNDDAISGAVLSLVAYKQMIVEENDRIKEQTSFDQEVAEMKAAISKLRQEFGLHPLEE